MLEPFGRVMHWTISNVEPEKATCAVGDRPMSSLTFRSSRPDTWTAPRPYTDPNLRMMKYGRVRPMNDDRSFFSRLFSN